MPVANFTANVTTINAGGSVNFSDLTTNSPTSWSWSFQGAQTATSTIKNPSNIIYNSAGTYTVTLIASNSFGSDTEIKTNYIQVNAVNPLIADFVADKTEILIGEVVHFTDISTGNPIFWSWEFEGGNPAMVNMRNPGVVYDFPGTYNVKLTVYRAGGNDSEIKYDYITVTEPVSLYPPGWEFSTTTRTHVIAVPLSANPRIHLTPIEPGDFIGVFYNGSDGLPKCGGLTQWDGVANKPVVAFGNDASIVKNGFSINETFQWKIYSMSMEREFEATVTYDPTAPKLGKFFPTGLSALTDIYTGNVFTLSIPAGWSGISSPIDPWEKSLDKLFLPVLNELILMNNFNGVYAPGMNINTLVTWNNHNGYNFKLENPVEIEFLGYPEKHLTLAIPQGWSFLNVPVACNVDVASLFSSQLSKLNIVREACGFKMYWPQYNINTLQTLYPGKAYLINAVTAFNLPFTACSTTLKNSGVAPVSALLLNPEWNLLPAGASVHTLAVTASACNQLKTGDILGVFTIEGYCAGMAAFEGKEFAVSVFGNDVTTTSKDGFDQGEPLTFKLYRPSENVIWKLDVTFDTALPDGSEFLDNGLSAISGFKHLTIQPGNDGTINPSIFPNPTTGNFVLTGIRNVGKICVMSAQWQIIIEINADGSETKEVDMTGNPRGIYFIRFETTNGILVRKIVID